MLIEMLHNTCRGQSLNSKHLIYLH